jgi:mannose-6-phosphate isomerase-like protein (cupin superfamily)
MDLEVEMNAINLEQKLEVFSKHWSPKVVSSYNENEIMVVKVQGEFNWHSHPDSDDFFFVVKGKMRIEMRDDKKMLPTVYLSEGELYVVPKGVEHRPVADEEAHLMLIEPKGMPNTGDEKTAAIKEKI